MKSLDLESARWALDICLSLWSLHGLVECQIQPNPWKIQCKCGHFDHSLRNIKLFNTPLLSLQRQRMFKTKIGNLMKLVIYIFALSRFISYAKNNNQQRDVIREAFMAFFPIDFLPFFLIISHNTSLRLQRPAGYLISTARSTRSSGCTWRINVTVFSWFSFVLLVFSLKFLA